ncbi:hypothetical protein P153DRAFT_365792 [Dothidotthia symphoricarpi CBS 119687]|uniref:Uncharacterized protein n=1 Tax=Dothidotthia symphoricarpi CBS 119687 TaxID=1392245 RepID=A0A6A6AGY3_9PLEO|nr:uncharacterized protein P153DRAFT_365792 [Dothidotthia symphoricarpi CBS 119687]KAF2131199.1 hypothetical protein P153DRAFT_365792 [Dothidotthia symphoricarpi CBS 119687]
MQTPPKTHPPDQHEHSNYVPTRPSTHDPPVHPHPHIPCTQQSTTRALNPPITVLLSRSRRRTLKVHAAAPQGRGANRRKEVTFRRAGVLQCGIACVRVLECWGVFIMLARNGS